MTIKTFDLRRFQLTGSALLIAFSLVGCGGGSDAAPMAAEAAPPVVAAVPDTAFATTEASLAFQRALTADDRAEPLQIGTLTPPTNDRAEPVEIDG